MILSYHYSNTTMVLQYSNRLLIQYFGMTKIWSRWKKISMIFLSLVQDLYNAFYKDP